MNSLLQHAYATPPTPTSKPRPSSTPNPNGNPIIHTTHSNGAKRGPATVIDPIQLKTRQILSKSHLGSISKVFYQKKPYILKERHYSELGRTKSLLHEIRIFQKLSQKCKYIVKMEGYYRKERSVCMLLEEATNGDLYHLIQKRKSMQRLFSEDEILSIMKGITEALVEVHACHIIHRDLKTLNVFVDEKGIVRLGDFGISRQVSNETVYVQTYSLGTPLYLSPEVIENRPYNEKIDLWSLGVILYELLTCGSYPFEADSLKVLMHKICVGRFHLQRDMEKHYSDGWINLLHMLLRRDFSRRPSAKEVLEILNSLGTARDVDICAPLKNTESRPSGDSSASQKEDKRLIGSTPSKKAISSSNGRVHDARKMNGTNLESPSSPKLSPKQQKVIQNRERIFAPPSSPTLSSPKRKYSPQNHESPIPPDPKSNEFVPNKKKDFLIHHEGAAKNSLSHRNWRGREQQQETQRPQNGIAAVSSRDRRHRADSSPVEQFYVRPTRRSRPSSAFQPSSSQHGGHRPVHVVDSNGDGQSKGRPSTARPSSSRRDARWEARRQQLVKEKQEESAKSQEKQQLYRKSIHDRAPGNYEPVRRSAPNQHAGKRFNILLGEYQ